MNRTHLGTAGRLAAGAVLAAGVLAATGAGIAFGWFPHTVTPVSVVVAAPAADRVLTCAGPLLTIGRNAADAAQVTSAAPDRITKAGDLAQDQLAAPGAPPDAGPDRLSAAAQRSDLPQAAAAASASVLAPDLAGFSAAACEPALMQSWLVGGATTTGATDFILLANPGAVPATVDLTLYGRNGPVEPAAGADIIVAPAGQRIVPLAALGLGEDAPVVQVRSTGAPVRAALQTGITRLLVPGGVDQQGAIIAASGTQTITGVRVTRPPQENATTIVRLLAPSRSTTATVTLLGEAGVVGTARHIELEAGLPVGLALDGLVPGTYSVDITADAPVVGALWQATGFGAGDDFAWVNAAPALPADGAGTLVAVPQGPSPQLVLTAGADATAHISGVDGAQARTVLVPAGRTTTVAVAAGEPLLLSTDGPVHAAVAFAGAGAAATFPVWPADAASAPVVVHP